MNIETTQQNQPTITAPSNNITTAQNQTLTPAQNNIEASQNTINSYYNKLKNEYEKLSKEYDEKVMNDYSQFGALFRPWSAEQYRRDMQKTRNERDKTYELLRMAEGKQIENQMNIENLKNKYKYEKESLKDVGINNPYFMLKNGPIANNVNLTSSINSGSYNTKYEKTKVPGTWETILKMIELFSKFGGKGGGKGGGMGQILQLLPMLGGI